VEIPRHCYIEFQKARIGF